MATYSAQCSAVGSFSYASYFKLYVVLTETDVSIENNTSKIQYNVYCQSSGSGSISAKHLKYFNLNGTDIINSTESVNASSPNAYIAIASGTTSDITHNDDGSKSVSFSAKIQASSYGVSASLSGTFTLTTIARASSVSGGTGNIGSTSTISISRASSSFTHTLRYAFGSLSGTIATGVGTSYTWTIPTSFYAQIPSAKSGTGTIYCDTYNGSTLIGTKSVSFTATATESSCRPTVSATLKDTNSTTTALTGNSSKLVKYKSTAQLIITSTVKNSASIKSVTVNGTNVGTSSSITVNYSNVSTASFTIVTTDSRGYTNTSYVVTPSYVNYVPLTINANFFRPQPTTGEVQLTYSGNYFDGSFGAQQNSVGIEWHYRVKGSSTWIKGGTITPTISGNTIVKQTISLGTIYDYQTAYEFYFYAQDFLTSVSTTASVSVGMPVFYWGKDFLNVTGDLQINGRSVPAYYLRNFNRSMASSNTNLDNPGINGLFEVRHNELSYTGTKPLDGYYPFLNLKTPDNIVMLQIAGMNGNLYYREKQSANVTLSGINWVKIRDSLNWGVSLFDNSSGITGTVTLSETSANFSYLEIFYKDSNYSLCDSVTTYSPNGKILTCDIGHTFSQSGTRIVASRRIKISGNSITNNAGTTDDYGVWFSWNNSIESTNRILIYKVVGYR